jgi:flagellin-like protein
MGDGRSGGLELKMNIQRLIQKTKKMQNDRKGVSPVISTIIIVAVAIAISIAVALYLTGITGTFTRFERLDVTSAYYDTNATTTTLDDTVNMTVKNSGTSVLSIDQVLKNGVPINPTVESGNSGPIVLDGSGASDHIIQLEQGEADTIDIFGIDGTPGQSIEVTLHTVSGKEYPKVVVVP